jgi:DNA-binding CsgD family transcriptional regulator
MWVGQELIDAAWGVRSALDYDRCMLEIVRRFIGYDAAFVGRMGVPSPAFVGFEPSQMQPDDTRRWRSYVEETLEARLRLIATQRGAGRDGEIIPRARYERTRLFREMMQPLRLNSILAGFHACGGRSIRATLVLARASGSFSEADRQRLSSIMPALSLCELARRNETAIDLASAPLASAPLALARLTAREAEIIEYLRLGYTNREIAAALGTSHRTVRNQLTSIFAKLGATTRAEAVALSLSGGPERHPLLDALAKLG